MTQSQKQTPADKIKETAAAATNEHALSLASKTESPVKEQGDGKAPYKEDFSAVYKRLADIEARLDKIEERLGGNTPDHKNVDLEQRLGNIEARLASATA